LGQQVHRDCSPQLGSIIAKEHRGQNGFPDIHLNIQLRQHGNARVILIGLVANTCIEATGRYVVELNFHATLVKGATAVSSPTGYTPRTR
jgi:nicotinamidase-related amidase